MLIRFPSLELSAYDRHVAALVATGNCQFGDSVEYVSNLKRPRFIWTHLPLTLSPTQLLEKKPKGVLGERISSKTKFCHLDDITEKTE